MEQFRDAAYYNLLHSSPVGYSVHMRMAHHEPLLRIGPEGQAAETCLLQQICKAALRVLITILGVNAFTPLKVALTLRPTHSDSGVGFQMHLYPALLSVEKTTMSPCPHIEIRTKQMIQVT